MYTMQVVRRNARVGKGSRNALATVLPHGQNEKGIMNENL